MPDGRALTWRVDTDALAFWPDNHLGVCMVHRRAFRTMLKFNPTPTDCEAFFRGHEQAFQAAARAKILRADVPAGMNFHLTSRDVTRQMRK
jgi:hypothetical protein